MALKSNEFRGVLIAGLATFVGFIFFAIAAGGTEYYHAYVPAAIVPSNILPSTWGTGDVYISYGPYRRQVKPQNADGFNDFIDRTCYPGIDISGIPGGVAGYGTPLVNCDSFNAMRAFHVMALVITGIAGLVFVAAAYRPVSFTLVVFIGLFAGFAGVISSIVGGTLDASFDTTTFSTFTPAVSFEWGYSFILSVFGWALTLASTGLYVAAKWDESSDVKQ